MKEFFEELRNADSVTDVLMEHKKETLQLAAVAVVLMLAVLLYLHQGSSELEITDGAASGDAVRSTQAGAGTEGSAGQTGEGSDGNALAEGGTGTGLPLDTDGIVYVDIGGAVNHPMLAELPTGSRVEDAIEAAGGLTKKADMTSVNRAQVLTDGEKVYIPEEGEAMDAAGTAEAGAPAGAAEGSGSGAAGISNGRININTADVTLLQQITGVGPVTAQKIVDYREQNGKFQSVEDLKNVSGIGEKTFEKMKDEVTT